MHDDLWELYCKIGVIAIFSVLDSVILLPAHPASFVHAKLSFYFSESQDGIVLQPCDMLAEQFLYFNNSRI